jgi:hypothetical protein
MATSGFQSASISGATQANPCVITTSGNHNLNSGDVVMISGVGGMTQLNQSLPGTFGIFCVTVLTATTFQLNGINSSAFGAYTSGGTVTQIPIGFVLATNTSIYRGGLWGLNIFPIRPNAVGVYCDGDLASVRGSVGVEVTAGGNLSTIGWLFGSNFSQNAFDISGDIRGITNSFSSGVNKVLMAAGVQVPGLKVFNLVNAAQADIQNAGVSMFYGGAVYDSDLVTQRIGWHRRSDNSFGLLVGTPAGSGGLNIRNTADTAGAPLSAALVHAPVNVTYSASMTFDASTGGLFEIVPSNTTAFTINNPTNPTDGQKIGIRIMAIGLSPGAVTLGAAFSPTSLTPPAAGGNRTYWFEYRAVNSKWYQAIAPQTVDVPN